MHALWSRVRIASRRKRIMGGVVALGLLALLLPTTSALAQDEQDDQLFAATISNEALSITEQDCWTLGGDGSFTSELSALSPGRWSSIPLDEEGVMLGFVASLVGMDAMGMVSSVAYGGVLFREESGDLIAGPVIRSGGEGGEQAESLNFIAFEDPDCTLTPLPPN